MEKPFLAKDLGYWEKFFKCNSVDGFEFRGVTEVLVAIVVTLTIKLAARTFGPD